MAAGLGYKEFSTGDVLTAADANGYLASQVVMVFASSAARASAITSPQEGMITYLKDTDVTQYYSGSAYVTIGGNTGALTLLSSTSFTTSSAHSVNDVFSTTYQNYLIQLNMDPSSATGYQQMRMRVSAADNTTSNYFWSGLYNLSNASTVTGEAGSAQTSFTYGYLESGGTGSWTMNIANPFETKPTTYALTSGRYNGTQSVLYYNSAAFSASTSFTGFTLYPASGTITGKVRVYGYNNA
jgi:hypothetical protein